MTRAEAMHAAIRAFLAALATGSDGLGVTIPRHRLQASPAVQALSDAADAWQQRGDD